MEHGSHNATQVEGYLDVGVRTQDIGSWLFQLCQKECHFLHYYKYIWVVCDHEKDLGGGYSGEIVAAKCQVSDTIWTSWAQHLTVLWAHLQIKVLFLAIPDIIFLESNDDNPNTHIKHRPSVPATFGKDLQWFF